MTRVVRSNPLKLLVAVLMLAASFGFGRAAAAADDPLLHALRQEMERSKANLKLENVPAPFYIEYRVTDVEQFEADAVFGALRRQDHNRGRLLHVVVRVGDYKQDSYYQAGEGVSDLLPLDDDIFATRRRIWLATDRAYKLASEALTAKQAALRQLKVDQPVDDFAQAPPVELMQPLAHLPEAEFASWVRLVEEASNEFRSDPELQSLDSSFRFTTENRYILNSEGTATRTGSTHCVMYVGASAQAADGMLLQRSHGDTGHELKDLPSREEVLKTTRKLVDTLKQLRAAPVVDEEYRGPVLFSNDAAATVVSDLIAPNVVGKKPRLGQNARTAGAWSSSYKARVLPDFVNVYDDPTITSVAGERLLGDYAVDDEGVKAQRVSVVEKGQLVSYLVGRQPIRDVPISNGHGRGSASGAPAPSVGNLVLQSSEPQTDAGLKKKLIELCQQRDLQYCYYVQTMGPNLGPRLLYRVWANDGHEELVRGAVFGELDVRALRSNLVAAGTAVQVEDRLEPVVSSVASPALLFDELLVRRSEATKQKLPVYPPPELGRSGEQSGK